MPVTIRPLGSGFYQVSTPGGIKARATTWEKAIRLRNLLNAVDHGWRPTWRPVHPERRRVYDRTPQRRTRGARHDEPLIRL